MVKREASSERRVKTSAINLTEPFLLTAVAVRSMGGETFASWTPGNRSHPEKASHNRLPATAETG